MAIFYCQHKRLQLENGTYYCLDCQAKFDVIPYGAKLPVITNEVKIEKPDPSPADAGYGKNGWDGWQWKAAIAAVVALGAIWKGCGSESSKIAQVAPQSISVAPCDPKVIEKEVPVEKEKIVYRDKECPEIKQGVCKPEIIYVPQTKPNCTKEIAAACKECRQSLEFFLKRQGEPSTQFRLDDSEEEDEFDKPF